MTVATLGFALPTAPLLAASNALSTVAASATNVGVAATQATAGMTAVGTAAKATTAAAVAQTSALNASASAHVHHGAAANNNSIAMLELFHVSRSLTEQFAMGVSPLRALTMEFGRITTLLQYGGGVTGVLSLFGSMLSKLLNPTILLGGALAGLGAIGLAAFAGWEGNLDKLQVALGGIGRQTGLTLDALNRVAVMGAQSGNISVSSAQGLTAQFAATGKIGPDMISQLLGTAKQFATGTGQSLDDAGKELAAAFAEPVKGADTLNAKLGLLDDATLEQIKSFTASGQVIAAQGVLLRSLQNDIATVSDQTWTWTKIWQGLGTAASDALGAVGSAEQRAFDPTLLQKYQAALNPNSAVTPAMWAEFFSNFGKAAANSAHSTGLLQLIQGSQLSSIPAVDDLNEQLRRQNALASQQGAAVATNLQSISSAKIIDSINSEVQAYRDLTDKLAELSGVSAETVAKLAGGIDVYGNLVNGAQLYAQTVDQLTQAHGTFLTSFQREIEAGQLQIAGTTAQTLADRAAVAVAQERLSLAGSMTTALQAEALVEQKLADTIAGATKASQDNARESQNAAATAGLSGYQLQVAQIQQKYAELARQTTVPTTISMPVPQTPQQATQPQAPSYMTDAAKVDAARLSTLDLSQVQSKDPGAGGYGTLSAAQAAPSVPTAPQTSAAIQTTTQAYNTLAVAAQNSATATRNSAAQQRDLATLLTNQTKPAIDAANKAIDAQISMLGVQEQTFGQSVGAIAAATEKQQLLNQFTKDGTPISDVLAASIDKTAQRYGAAATAADNFRLKSELVISTMDGIRTASTDALSTFTTDLMNGESAADALNDALKNVVNDILQVEEKNLVTGLLGASGTAQGGALGGGILSALKGIFGLAGGGPVVGPGTGTSDSVPIWASNGEYLVNAAGTARNRKLLDAINSGNIIKMASGGPIGSSMAAAGGSATSNVSVTVVAGKNDQVQVKDVKKAGGGIDIALLVNQTVTQAIATPGSTIHRQLKSTFGVQQQLTRRGG